MSSFTVQFLQLVLFIVYQTSSTALALGKYVREFSNKDAFAKDTNITVKIEGIYVL